MTERERRLENLLTIALIVILALGWPLAGAVADLLVEAVNR